MKIALCVHGLSAGVNRLRGGKILFGYTVLDNSEGLNQLKQISQLDVFVHTWNSENKDKIEKQYEPKKLIIEEISSDIKKKVLDLDNFPRRKKYMNSHLYCKYSNFYSQRQADLLRITYQKENDFEYDCVIHTRFDVHFTFNPEIFLTFDIDSNYYIPGRVKKGMPNWYYNLMIISSGKLIEEFTKIYFEVDKLIDQLAKEGKKQTHGKKLEKHIPKLNNHFMLGYFFKNNEINNIVEVLPHEGVIVKQYSIKKPR